MAPGIFALIFESHLNQNPTMRTVYDVPTAQEQDALLDQTLYFLLRLQALRRNRIRPTRSHKLFPLAEVFAKRHYAQGKLHTF